MAEDNAADRPRKIARGKRREREVSGNIAAAMSRAKMPKMTKS